MKSGLAGRLTRGRPTLGTLLLAGFLWLGVAPLISVIVLPWMGAATAIVLAAVALPVAYAAAVALTAPALQRTPAPVAERAESARAWRSSFTRTTDARHAAFTPTGDSCDKTGVRFRGRQRS